MTVLTTHRLTINPSQASDVLKVLRADMADYMEEVGLISVGVYRTPKGSEILLVGFRSDLAKVTEAMKAIYARRRSLGSFEKAELTVYSLVETFRR